MAAQTSWRVVIVAGVGHVPGRVSSRAQVGSTLWGAMQLRGIACGNRPPREVLGVALNCTEAEVKTAFRQLAKKVHPDMNTKKDREVASREFQIVEKAYKDLLAELSGKAPNGATSGSTAGRQTAGPWGQEASWAAHREEAAKRAASASAAGQRWRDPSEVGYSMMPYVAGIGVALLILHKRSQQSEILQERQNLREFGEKRVRLRQEAAERHQLEVENELARKRGGGGRGAAWKTSYSAEDVDVDSTTKVDPGSVARL